MRTGHLLKYLCVIAIVVLNAGCGRIWISLKKNINNPANPSPGNQNNCASASPVMSAALCDSGDLDGTCIISSAKTVLNGTSITGRGGITIANGGSISDVSLGKVIRLIFADPSSFRAAVL